MNKKLKLKAVAFAVMGAFLSRTGLAMGALALVIEKDAHTKLADPIKALYVEKDGKYHLDAELEDTKGLKSALEKERDLNKATSKALKELKEQFEGLDPVKIREMLEKLGGDEEAQLIKAGKIDEVVAKRTERLRVELQKKVDAAEKKAELSQQRAGKFSAQVLDNHVRAAATKAGMHANAVDDALFRARTMFTLNEDGVPVQLDKEGAPVMGKDAKTPFSPSEWLEGMKETAPHWFPAGANGGGANGGAKNAAGVKQMKRGVFDALSPAEKTNFTVKEKGVVVD